MLIINIIVLIIYFVGYLICLRGPKDWVRELDKKEHKLYLFYPMASALLNKFHLDKPLFQIEKVSNSIKALYITSDLKHQKKLYWCSRISLLLFVILLFNLLLLFSQLEQSDHSTLTNGKYLIRPKAGEGSKEVELKVTLEKHKSEEASDHTLDRTSSDVIIEVKEQAYTKEEMISYFEQSIQYLKTDVLGSNIASEQITQDLHFTTRVPGTSIAVEWKPSDYTLIQSDGKVLNSELSEQGITTSVTAILTCQNYSKVVQLAFHILPRPVDPEENLKAQLEKQLIEVSKNNEHNRYLELPDTLGDYRLLWQGEDENSGITILILGLSSVLLLWFMGEKELEKQMKKRRDQLLFDYPELINKFILLVNAGMTMKQAWSKIAEDYVIKRKQNKLIKHYAYEEMLVTVNELSLGIPENTAYEQFGRRIGLISYIKFSSLIGQNLKKGNKGVTELLMKEAVDAFEDRKEMAKRLGEEAGTKLLLPMLIMLIIVFMIILIPAFWSFQM